MSDTQNASNNKKETANANESTDAGEGNRGIIGIIVSIVIGLILITLGIWAYYHFTGDKAEGTEANATNGAGNESASMDPKEKEGAGAVPEGAGNTLKFRSFDGPYEALNNFAADPTPKTTANNDQNAKKEDQKTKAAPQQKGDDAKKEKTPKNPDEKNENKTEAKNGETPQKKNAETTNALHSAKRNGNKNASALFDINTVDTSTLDAFEKNALLARMEIEGKSL